MQGDGHLNLKKKSQSSNLLALLGVCLAASDVNVASLTFSSSVACDEVQTAFFALRSGAVLVLFETCQK